MPVVSYWCFAPICKSTQIYWGQGILVGLWVGIVGFSKVVANFSQVGRSFNIFMATTGDFWIIPSFQIWGYLLHVAHISCVITNCGQHQWVFQVAFLIFFLLLSFLFTFFWQLVYFVSRCRVAVSNDKSAQCPYFFVFVVYSFYSLVYCNRHIVGCVCEGR